MNIQLRTNRLQLSTLNADFAELVQAYLTENEGFFRPYSPSWPLDFTTLDSIRSRLRQQLRQMRQKTFLRFFIFHQSDKARLQIIGDISYSNIIYGPFCSCFLGYKVAHRYRGLGITVEALQATNNYLLEQWGLHRIEANIMPHNKASIRVVEKLGFEAEGLARQFLQINGQWQDHLRYALRKQ